MNYYDLLRVDTKATKEEIRKAYRCRCKEYHPDLNKSKDAERIYKLIQEAYHVLSNPLSKETYDRINNYQKRNGADKRENKDYKTFYKKVIDLFSVKNSIENLMDFFGFVRKSDVINILNSYGIDEDIKLSTLDLTFSAYEKEKLEEILNRLLFDHREDFLIDYNFKSYDKGLFTSKYSLFIILKGDYYMLRKLSGVIESSNYNNDNIGWKYRLNP